VNERARVKRYKRGESKRNKETDTDSNRYRQCKYASAAYVARGQKETVNTGQRERERARERGESTSASKGDSENESNARYSVYLLY
jgi:hypothetical protein